MSKCRNRFIKVGWLGQKPNIYMFEDLHGYSQACQKDESHFFQTTDAITVNKKSTLQIL